MVYAKSALTMLFGMLFLLSLCIGFLEKAFLAFKTKIQILRKPGGLESRLLAKLEISILKQEIGFSTPKLREK